MDEFRDEAQRLEDSRSKREQDFDEKGSYEELERTFWKNVCFVPSVYGADSPGSLCSPALKEWNLSKLNSILELVSSDIGGVTTPFLYFGQWKSAFCWHVEDMNLHSINYLHFGKAKQWYVVPPRYADRFETLAQSLFPTQYRACPEFLRHKTSMISPAILKNHGIPIRRIVHKPGEFMITFPRSYHMGFNYEYNCAESVNFATERWIPVGQQARYCQCSPDSVFINMDEFITKLDAAMAAEKV